MIDQTIQFYVFLALVALNIFIIILFLLQRSRLNAFLQGKNGGNLEDLIKKASKDIQELHLGFQNVSNEAENQKKQLSSTIKKIGIVRFNPFNNTGGDQSFALALLDSMNSGIVISSLYLREGTRVYAKPIESLKSKYPLSKEEEEAIKKAIN